jgi:hypothetical protein
MTGSLPKQSPSAQPIHWPPLSNLIRPSSAHFVLLLVLDAAKLETGLVYAAAEKLLDKGMVYVCVWGPDGERVEDIFDKGHH